MFVTKCSTCDREFGPNQTPWAFPLNDMRFDAFVRFCSEHCLDRYAAENGNCWRNGKKPRKPSPLAGDPPAGDAKT